MDDFDAFQVVMTKVLESKDEEAIEALRVLIKPDPPFPPGALGGAGGSAAKLAEMIRKTGSENGWTTPPAHSQAMERLIHRTTLFLEALLDLFEDARLKEMAANGWEQKELTAMQASTAVVDELYQPGYCDDCGAELDVDGDCLICLMHDDLLAARTSELRLFFDPLDDFSSDFDEGENDG